MAAFKSFTILLLFCFFLMACGETRKESVESTHGEMHEEMHDEGGMMQNGTHGTVMHDSSMQDTTMHKRIENQ